jgi:hypothetical protein
MPQALGISIPSPTGRASPASASDDSSQIQTPVSPSFAEAPATATPGTSAITGKRKTARRANTAERRATHNAVERARRETLNGRFLDLAALLPNLSQIRRPSKSAIVNSSIAHVHASKRHRHLASRELRLLKLEADALRRELNEWRDRAGIPRVQEPVRGDGFSMVLNGEIEALPPPVMGGEDEDGDYPYGPEDDVSPPATTPSDEAGYDFRFMSVEQQQQQQQQHQMMRRGPMIASPGGGIAVDNPAMGMMYNSNNNNNNNNSNHNHNMGMPYPGGPGGSFISDMEPQGKWAPGPGAEQDIIASLSRRNSGARSRAMSTSSSGSGGSASPPGYFDPAWNSHPHSHPQHPHAHSHPTPQGLPMGGGMPMPMGMMGPGGGGSVGAGAAFSMMM